MNILDKIIAHKKQELIAQKAEVSLEQIQERISGGYSPRGFVSALRRAERPAVIAEIKRGSPSRGVFRRSLKPVETAISFSHAGACALSVLTDTEFFAGSLSLIPLIRDQLAKSNFQTPLLRKDFIIDCYQVWQSRSIGADALLLIVAALPQDQFIELLHESLHVGIDVLIEIHDEEELSRAVMALRETTRDRQTTAEVALGINNRDLRDFTISLDTSRRLAALAREVMSESDLAELAIPLISESGIARGSDIDYLHAAGVQGFLVGEALVLEGEPGENLRKLRDGATKGPV